MENSNKYFRGIFKGTGKKLLRIHRFTIDEVIQVVLEKITPETEGALKIYEADFVQGVGKLVKVVVIANDVFLTEEESLERKLPAIKVNH